MTILAQDVIDAAIQRSSLNNPDLVPNAQLLTYLSSFERKAFIDAARINPDFYGQEADTAVRADNTDSWDLTVTPGNVAAVAKAEVSAITGAVSGVAVGDKVRLVSKRYPEIEVPPRAYIRGQKIFPFKDELGADGTNFVTTLSVFYSELPAKITDLSQALMLPDEWQQVVILPLARVLAMRDRRDQEAQLIEQEFQLEYQSYLNHVGIFDHGANRPLVAVPAAGPQVGGAQQGG